MAVEMFPIFTNDNVSQVYQATKVCVRGKVLDDIEAQKRTLANSVGRGHESVLEHSNLICLLSIEKQSINYGDLLNIFECCKYLNIRQYEKDNKLFIIFAGSVRGYKHIFRSIKSMQNIYLEYIKDFLYATTIKDYYNDFIELGIMDESKFATFVGEKRGVILDYDDVADVVAKKQIASSNDKIEYLWYDNINDIYQQLLAAMDGYVIPLFDILDFCTIGIKFNQISRTASHQLVRHRNAISQESQRYVNYKDARFIDPELEDAIANKQVHMDATISDKLREVSEYCVKAYNELVDPNGKYKAKKENARAILPSNIETTLIMTFTYKNLLKAIELRVAPGAQAEIRNLFLSIADDIIPVIGVNTNEDLNMLIQGTIMCYSMFSDQNNLSQEILADTISEPIAEEEITEVEVSAAKSKLMDELGINPYEDTNEQVEINSVLLDEKSYDTKDNKMDV